MKTKALDSLKGMSTEDILAAAEVVRKNMFELRMKKVVAPIKNVHLLRGMRKDLATMLTVLAEKVKGTNER
jgi:ribosomal protein L29